MMKFVDSVPEPGIAATIAVLSVSFLEHETAARVHRTHVIIRRVFT
jgi:hypothetical protein